MEVLVAELEQKWILGGMTVLGPVAAFVLVHSSVDTVKGQCGGPVSWNSCRPQSASCGPAHQSVPPHSPEGGGARLSAGALPLQQHRGFLPAVALEPSYSSSIGKQQPGKLASSEQVSLEHFALP